ncbi:WD40-repeat-containing domain protein [Gorgonomyces haynaldii]|nr:WD40-repeat-containing domain protein [Gorgonomyces haynaldii]
MDEKPVGFASPEGNYLLKQHILIDVPQTLHPNIGTFVSFVTKKQQLLAHETAPQNKLIDSLLSDEKSNFSFLKGKRSSKSNVKETQLLSRIASNDQLAYVLSKNTPSFLLFNVGRAIGFVDSTYLLQNLLSVCNFKESFVTCHDINPLLEGMESIIGTNTGDLLYYSPLSGKYQRFNRSGSIHKYGVTCVKWIPGSENMFCAGFEDGSMLVFDKEMEDQVVPVPTASEEFLVSKPPKNTKHNPRSYWKISSKPLTCITFAPDSIHCAITSMDGHLRVIDYDRDILMDVYKNYFGGLLCAAWSPDGRFIVAGGQDDLISIWAFKGRLVAWCQGHMSWVTSISFDNGRCSDGTYRLVSVGEDTRICFWDFSLSGLHRKRHVNGTLGRGRSRMDMENKPYPVYHDPPLKAQVPVIEALICRKIHSSPLSQVLVVADAIVTADRIGNVCVWTKP